MDDGFNFVNFACSNSLGHFANSHFLFCAFSEIHRDREGEQDTA